MAYKKPQDPLTNNGFGIYPLTTADQVILSDGSRLEKNGVVDLVTLPTTEETPGNAPTINAGTFGGMTVSQFVEMIYPVGSIYMSANATSPASLFGGTWEQLKDRFLLAAGSTYSAGSTGGEAEHSLIANELPKIEGWIEAGAGSSGTPTSSGHGAFRSASGVFSTTRNCNYSYDNSDKAIWTPTDTDSWQQVNMSFGNDQPHNNMPPYLAVYMWKRVS